MTKLPITGEGLQCRAGCGRALGGRPHWETAQRTGDRAGLGQTRHQQAQGGGQPCPGPLPARAEGTHCPTAQPQPLLSARTPQARRLAPCVLCCQAGRPWAGRWLHCAGTRACRSHTHDLAQVAASTATPGPDFMTRPASHSSPGGPGMGGLQERSRSQKHESSHAPGTATPRTWQAPLSPARQEEGLWLKPDPPGHRAPGHPAPLELVLGLV